MLIINLTQHSATPEQQAAGVVDLQGSALEALKELLTFEALPTREEIIERAEFIAELAVQNDLGPDDGDDPIPDAAMIGGAPYLMGPLERALLKRYIRPLYAFSTREVEEQQQPDGSVRKVAIFRHKGFVEAVGEGENETTTAVALEREPFEKVCDEVATLRDIWCAF